MRVHVLQHVPFEGPGSIAAWLTARQEVVTTTRLFEAGAVLPPVSSFDVLIVLGGPMSANDEAASDRTMGRSTGAHGLRHSYAQERMTELQNRGLLREVALETVSQEMGHFRPEITEAYLR